jgi:hypothetical protein
MYSVLIAFWVLHPVAHLSNWWFLMMPQSQQSFKRSAQPLFSLNTCFGPYGPSSGEIFLRTIFTTTDPFHVYNLTYRCYMPISVFVLSLITCIGDHGSKYRYKTYNIYTSSCVRATDPL